MLKNLQVSAIVAGTTASFGLLSGVAGAGIYTTDGEFSSALFQDVRVVDFDRIGLSHREVITDNIEGIDFHGSVIAWDIEQWHSGGTFASAPIVLRNRRIEPIRFTLDEAVDGFGIYNPSLIDRLVLTLFDEQGDVITVQELPEGFVNFAGYVDASRRVKSGEIWVSDPTNYYFFVDSFVMGNVPAPAGLALLGSMGILGSRRRR